MWGSAQNLDHDGLLGSAEGLHCLVMGGLGEVFAIDLEDKRKRQQDVNLKSGGVIQQIVRMRKVSFGLVIP